MPGNSFICCDGIKPGESLHETHNGKDGWMEATDFEWTIEADTSFLKGGGAAVGKPTPGSLSFSHTYDVASPTIMLKIVQGKHFPKMHIVMLKSTGLETGKG